MMFQDGPMTPCGPGETPCGPGECSSPTPKLKVDQFKFHKLHDVYKTLLHLLMQLFHDFHSG